MKIIRSLWRHSTEVVLALYFPAAPDSSLGVIKNFILDFAEINQRHLECEQLELR